MYIGIGLIRYSSHGEVQCDHMLKSTSLMQVIFLHPIYISVLLPFFISCLTTSICISVDSWAVVFENILRYLTILSCSTNLGGLKKNTTITGKRDPVEECFTPRHCHLFSASWPLRDTLHCLNPQRSRVPAGVTRGQNWHHWPYVRSAPVEITRGETTSYTHADVSTLQELNWSMLDFQMWDIYHCWLYVSVKVMAF